MATQIRRAGRARDLYAFVSLSKRISERVQLDIESIVRRDYFTFAWAKIMRLYIQERSQESSRN